MLTPVALPTLTMSVFDRLIRVAIEAFHTSILANISLLFPQRQTSYLGRQPKQQEQSLKNVGSVPSSPHRRLFKCMAPQEMGAGIRQFALVGDHMLDTAITPKEVQHLALSDLRQR